MQRILTLLAILVVSGKFDVVKIRYGRYGGMLSRINHRGGPGHHREAIFGITIAS